ncbi:hypothetical protein GHK43_33440 [Sinorhizobium meliloti]|nr:hypothetical protein [Sinorhizobium meliloti]
MLFTLTVGEDDEHLARPLYVDRNRITYSSGRGLRYRGLRRFSVADLHLIALMLSFSARFRQGLISTSRLFTFAASRQAAQATNEEVEQHKPAHQEAPSGIQAAPPAYFPETLSARQSAWLLLCGA